MTVRPRRAATKYRILSSQSTDEELTEDDLLSQCSSQWSPTEGDDGLSQWSSIEEELETLCSSTKEEQSATEEGPDVPIPQESFPLTNIWNLPALKQTVIRMTPGFKVPYVPFHSPHASNSSSPLRYEYAYEATSTNDENVDQHLLFISPGILDYEDVDLIDLNALAQVGDMIHKHRLVQPGNPQILKQVFADNSALLERYLYDHFISAGLSIDKWTCMDAYEFTDRSANDCVMILTIATRLLCLMSNKLAEAECKSFDQDLRDYYFWLCARRLVENLIKASDAISNLKWPASHIYQMLVLYKAIDDVLRAIDCPSDSDRIFQQMRVNFKGIFDDIKRTIWEYLNGPQCMITQVQHPATNFLIRSMKLFTIHSSTVQYTCIGDGSSSLGQYLSELISYWAEQLRAHFMSYSEGRNYMFLLNNLTHFDEETVEFLQELMPSSESHSEPGYILKSLIDMNTQNYLMECYGPVRNCVLISGPKPCWSSLDAFTSQFNIVYKRQKMWSLKTQLKRKLRQQIEEFLVPNYNTFLKKLLKGPIPHARFLVQKRSAGQQAKYMSTEELQSALRGMFESA